MISTVGDRSERSDLLLSVPEVQHFVWPFRGVGERRTIAANIARPEGEVRWPKQDL